MKIKWAIVGTGWMANKFAQDFHAVENGSLHAVVSRSLSAANGFAQQYQIPIATDNMNDIIQNEEIDIIYITSPHAYHYEQALRCLQHKKAVLCEKPVTINGVQLQHLVEVAKENNVFFMEAMWMYFLPPIIKVQEWLQQGLIGEVKCVRAELGYKNIFNPNHRLFNPADGGGALLDIGIYPIALAVLLLGDHFENIQAEAKFNILKTDDQTIVQLKTVQGVMAQLCCSFNATLRNEAVIYGDTGTIHIPDFFMSREAYLKSEQGEEYFKDERATTGYNYEADEVNRLLLTYNKESNIMPLSKSIAIMRVLDTVRLQIGLIYPME